MDSHMNAQRTTFKRMEILGIVLVCVCATLLHFTYEWSGENAFYGLFSAVNESVWEHTKLVYFPMLVYAVIEFFVLRPNWKRFFAAKAVALVFSSLMMVVVFYTYSGAFGVEILLVDIISLYVLTALGFLISFRLYYSHYRLERYWPLFCLLALVHFSAEVLLTPLAPDLPLFEDHSH